LQHAKKNDAQAGLDRASCAMDQCEAVQAKSSRLATPAGLKNLSNYKVLRGQTESTPPIGSKGLSGALATPGSTDPPPIIEKAASGWRPGRGVSKTAMEEGETSKCKNSLPSPTLQAQAALKLEAAPSELGAAHG
jgi:hypothetical protein